MRLGNSVGLNAYAKSAITNMKKKTINKKKTIKEWDMDATMMKIKTSINTLSRKTMMMKRCQWVWSSIILIWNSRSSRIEWLGLYIESKVKYKSLDYFVYLVSNIKHWICHILKYWLF